MIIGGTHGNEPAGTETIKLLIKELNENKIKQNFNNTDEMEKLKRSIKAAREAAEKVANTKKETEEQ